MTFLKWVGRKRPFWLSRFSSDLKVGKRRGISCSSSSPPPCTWGTLFFFKRMRYRSCKCCFFFHEERKKKERSCMVWGKTAFEDRIEVLNSSQLALFSTSQTHPSFLFPLARRARADIFDQLRFIENLLFWPRLKHFSIFLALCQLWCEKTRIFVWKAKNLC